MLSLTIPQVPGAPTPTHRAAAAAAARDALTRGRAA